MAEGIVVASETVNAITLGIAIAGLVFSLVGLSWQFWTFIQLGARVKSRFSESRLIDAITEEATYTITASNAGRGSVQVTQIGLETPHGIWLQQNPRPEFPIPPKTLDGGHEESFYWVAETIDVELKQIGWLQPFVRLGNGKRVDTPQRLVWKDGKAEVVERSRRRRRRLRQRTRRG